MGHDIQALNVAGAALLMQVLFIVIVAITSHLYNPAIASSTYANHERIKVDASRFPWILSTALASIAVILMSDQFSTVWEPLFNGATISTISTIWALNIMFALDLALISYLVRGSGGSQQSPFAPALFIIPSLGIFLRTPPAAFISYSVLSAGIYWYHLYGARSRYNSLEAIQLQSEKIQRRAAAFMTLSCLLLAMLTGYITRPIPVPGMSGSTKMAGPKHSVS